MALRWWRRWSTFPSRRRSNRVIMAVTALFLTVALLYLHYGQVDSTRNMETYWRGWNPLSLLSGRIEQEFTPVPSVDCQNKPQSGYPFCNPSLSSQQRATDLVSRLTVEELILQTSSLAPAISRLGIKYYNWRSNCLHGWSDSGGNWLRGLFWTVFPAPIGLSASFNSDLVRRVGEVTADEGRALHNVMLAHYNGTSNEAAGLNCFSPNVNLLRDPRWGRGQETFGEDPYLVSLVGAAYTHGLQEGDDPKYLKIAACAKHFAVHSGPDELRATFVANVSLHDLYDTFLPAFKSQVLGAKVAQMMPAYSGMRCKYQPDGAPDDANPYLLKTVLRKHFKAANISVISDNGAVAETFITHHYAPNLEVAAALCMNATTDLDLGLDEVYPKYLPKSYRDSEVTFEAIQDAVWRSFFLRIQLGDFDPPSKVSYQNINASHLNTPENQELNLQAARESIVLLKNLDSLPLSVDAIRRLAVIGPNANATTTLLSNYEGIPSTIVSVLKGIQDAVNDSSVEVSFAPGCISVGCPNTSFFDNALEIVSNADYVIMVMGLDSSVEGEGYDRNQTSCESVEQDVLALPGCQTELVEKVVQHNPKVILVLINGGPVSLPDLYYSKGVVGILEAFYPGALGGTAVADVLFGKYNPGGKMPMTLYESSKDILPSVNYNMTQPPGRTYRYFTGTPLIPFGFGLSYTEFEYSQLVVTPTSISPCGSVKVSVSVQNTGEIVGDEVIQVYVKPPMMPDKPFIPKSQLLGFERAPIKPSMVHLASFELNPYLLSLVDTDGEHYIFPGKYTVQIGLDGEDAVTDQFTITGNAVNVNTCTDAPQCLAC